LCLAKFLPGLDGLIPPLAGAEGVSFTAFFALDAVGSLLWSGFYVLVGYLFSSQLDLAIDWTKQFGTALCFMLVVPSPYMPVGVGSAFCACFVA
jgi:membrane protein DedA with SNARE-associated domain